MCTYAFETSSRINTPWLPYFNGLAFFPTQLGIAVPSMVTCLLQPCFCLPLIGLTLPVYQLFSANYSIPTKSNILGIILLSTVVSLVKIVLRKVARQYHKHGIFVYPVPRAGVSDLGALLFDYHSTYVFLHLKLQYVSDTGGGVGTHLEASSYRYRVGRMSQ